MQQAVNTVPWQPKHNPTSTTPGPSLGNSPFNMSLSNTDNLGNDVSYVACAKVI